jgi:hypothetical protein
LGTVVTSSNNYGTTAGLYLFLASLSSLVICNTPAYWAHLKAKEQSVVSMASGDKREQDSNPREQELSALSTILLQVASISLIRSDILKG